MDPRGMPAHGTSKLYLIPDPYMQLGQLPRELMAGVMRDILWQQPDERTPYQLITLNDGRLAIRINDPACPYQPTPEEIALAELMG